MEARECAKAPPAESTLLNWTTTRIAVVATAYALHEQLPPKPPLEKSLSQEKQEGHRRTLEGGKCKQKEENDGSPSAQAS